MSRPGRAGLVLALLLLPLVPAAGAGAPEPAEWSPWIAPQPVNALAIAVKGQTIAAALGGYSPTPNCPPTACAPAPDTESRYDLALLHAQGGFVAASQENFDLLPRGRTLVAVSHDGGTVVSIGLDTNENSRSTPVPTLYYSRASQPDNWTSTSVRLTQYLDGTPVGLLLSADGRRVAVASDAGGSVSVRGYAFQSGILSESFSRPELLPGNVTGFAGSADLSRLALSARVPTAEGNRSAVVRMEFSGGAAGLPHYLEGDVSLSRAAYARDGSAFAVGGTNATLLYFRGAAGPQALPLDAAGAVGALAFSGDGTRLAAAVNGTIQAFDLGGGDPAPLWRAQAADPVRSLAYNLTGGVLAASGRFGVAGYNDEGADLGWTIFGQTTFVAIDDAASYVAYYQRDRVFAQALPRGLVLSFEDGADFGATRDVPPGGSAAFDLLVQNAGAVPERVAFRGATDLDVSLAFDPATLLLNPGQSTRVVATLTPGQLQAGARSLNVTAFSTTSGLADDAVLNFTLQGVVGIGLTSPEQEVVLRPGEPHELLLAVRNDGTEDVAVSLTARQSTSEGEAWNVTLDPSSLTLPPDIVTTVRATVTPPAGAENGTSNAVTYVLEGGGQTREAKVVYRINPTLGVDVLADRSFKYVTPGETVRFNVSVTNTGSLPGEFQVYYDVNDSGGRAWNVVLDAPTLRLDPRETRVVAVHVTAPADIASEEQLRFSVTAELVPAADPAVKDSVLLFATAARPVTPDGDDDEGNVIPGPAAWLLVATALSVAVSLRRRRAP